MRVSFNLFRYVQSNFLTTQCCFEIVEMPDVVFSRMRESGLANIRGFSQQFIKVLQVILCKYACAAESVGEKMFITISGETNQNTLIARNQLGTPVRE